MVFRTALKHYNAHKEHYSSIFKAASMFVKNEKAIFGKFEAYLVKMYGRKKFQNDTEIDSV